MGISEISGSSEYWNIPNKQSNSISLLLQKFLENPSNTNLSNLKNAIDQFLDNPNTSYNNKNRASLLLTELHTYSGILTTIQTLENELNSPNLPEYRRQMIEGDLSIICKSENKMKATMESLAKNL